MRMNIERMVGFWPAVLVALQVAFAITGLASVGFAEAPQLRLRLKEGSFVDGQLRPVSAETIGVETSQFTEPLEFDVRALRSVSGDFSTEDPKSGHAFLLDGGTRITGQLKQWDDKSVVVESKSLGEITIQRSMLRAVESVTDIGKRVYAGPRSIDDWEILDQTGKWGFEAGSLVSPDNEAEAAGKVDLPSKFRLKLSMSWAGRADFVLSLGCSKPAKPEPAIGGRARRMVKPSLDNAAVRLEMWDAQLAVVREVGNLADIAVLPLDDGISKFDLVFYVDQVAGLVAVYSPRGRMLEKIQVAEEKGTTNAYALLKNHGKSVSLDSFEVFQWDGYLPDSTEFPEGYVLGKDEKVVQGDVVGFDTATGMLEVNGSDGEESEFALDQVRRIVQIAPKETDEAGDAQFKKIPLDEDRMIEVEFADTSRLVGYMAKPQGGLFAFRGNGLAGEFTCKVDDIVAVSGSSETFDPKAIDAPRRTLTLQAARLTGSLVDNPSPDGDAVLKWHPWGAKSAVSIVPGQSGSITSGNSTPKKVPAPSKNANAAQAGFRKMIGGFIGGGKLRVDQPKGTNGKASLKTLPKFEIVFRSGDAIDGVVQFVDDRGVTFASEETATTFVPHEKMDSITLARSISKPEFSAEDMKRLLTVPRSKKSDPPTHLFISTTGDYLRGRLIGINAENVGVEVRLDVQEIPRKNIARVIWLHDRPWLSEEAGQGGNEAGQGAPIDKKAGQNPFLVHAVRAGKNGVTFAPTRMSNRRLIGESEFLGDCSVDVDDLKSLLFGPDVGAKALALRKESWTLSLAKLPKAYLDDGSDDANAPPMGTQSPLVGKDAPEIELQTIDDVEFVLSENRDKVIVLDFWASWCGPCIATMPKVEAIVAKHDPRKVELVAVNLQDSVQRAQIALDRMKIEPTVVMDVDGEAARFYDARAIPQTVIVDTNGKITHLFVGGGAKFLEQFSAALEGVLEK